MDVGYVYHASKIKGLKVLKPKVSTHKQSWVYATKNLATSAMFLGDNFDFICQTGGSVNHPYKGKGGVIYKLPADTFEEGKTSWAAEAVSELPVKVIEEITVPDALIMLETLEKEDKLTVYRFPNTPPSTPRDKSDIVQRAVRWTEDYGDKYLDLTNKCHPDILPQVIKQLKAREYKPETIFWSSKFDEYELP